MEDRCWRMDPKFKGYIYLNFSFRFPWRFREKGHLVTLPHLHFLPLSSTCNICHLPPTTVIFCRRHASQLCCIDFGPKLTDWVFLQGEARAAWAVQWLIRTSVVPASSSSSPPLLASSSSKRNSFRRQDNTSAKRKMERKREKLQPPRRKKTHFLKLCKWW